MVTTIEKLHTELEELKFRFADLETRVAAVESKELNDFNVVQEQMTRLAIDHGKLVTQVLNLASLHRAGQMAVLHLLGVTARAVRVSEAEIAEAMRMAAHTTTTDGVKL